MSLPRLNPPTPAALFAGGRAPACWQREARRKTAAPAALARACGWVGELAREPRPRLRRQPLLGHCLAELVDAAPQAAPPPADEPRRARPAAKEAPGQRPAGDHASTAKPQARPASPQAGAPEHGAAHRPKSAATAAGQPTKATPELLARRGGPARKHAPAPGPHAGQRRPALDRPTKRGQPPPPAERAGHELPARLVARVRQRALAVGAGPEGKRSPAATAPRPLPETPAADLVAQWRGGLAGQRAPAGWLAARRGPGGPAGAAGRGAGQRGQASAPDERRAMDAAGQPTVATDRPPAARRGAGWRPPARPRRPVGPETAHTPGRGSRAWPGPPTNGADAAPEAVADDVAAWGDGRLEADDGQVVSVVARFAPPRMADTLPPLRPPGPAAVAMPVAAAAARRSAQREEGAVVEDLDELATKLRRLLEEEARRHGIDI